ncbi:glycosyltransferase [Thermodesulfobacteriota bacterium]
MINPKKRLAFFVSSMEGGGAQRVMLNLAQEISEKGYAVDLVLARAEGPYLAQIPESVQLVDLKTTRILNSLPALAWYLRRKQPTAILSAINYVNIIALWARCLARVSTRVVVGEHSVSSYSAKYGTSWRDQLMPKLSYFYRWADGIVAVSEEVRNDLAQITGIPCERIRVIYNPVIKQELRRKSRVPLEHPWFGNNQPPVLLAVGRLAEVKDFRTLIYAFAQVRQTRPVRLLILGEGECRSSLESLVRQLGLEEDVSMPGFVENPYAYMAQASIFVMSSRFEALPTVLIEALYLGLPLIATDCPGGTREILRDGKVGQLVPVGDSIAIAQAIENILNLPFSPPPQETWRPFKIDTIVNQYLDVLLDGKPCA